MTLGDDRVDHILFLAGISPLSSLDGESDKLLFAFKVFDIKKIGSVSAPETISVLSSINACASKLNMSSQFSNELILPHVSRFSITMIFFITIIKRLFWRCGSFFQPNSTTCFGCISKKQYQK